MNEKGEVTKFREGDTKEHEGVTYVAVFQKKKDICARGARSIRGANRAKARKIGCV